LLEGAHAGRYIDRMARILGIDQGKKRTGVAISDEAGVVATPLEIIEARSRSAVIREICRIAKEHGVEQIVVGMPLDLDGTRGRRATDAERFARALAVAAGLPVQTWDERFSTMAVSRVLREADVSRSRRKGVLDSNAAAYILQGFLDSRRSNEGRS